MKQKKWMLLALAAFVAVGMGWLVASRQKAEPKDAEPVVAGRSVEDQQLLDSVLESPETLDGKSFGVRRQPKGDGALASAVPVCTLPTGKERHLLSDVEKPPAPRPLAEPVAADSLHFRKEYASLRTDAVRNPNSPENRAGVVSLMQARQRRLGQ